MVKEKTLSVTADVATISIQTTMVSDIETCHAEAVSDISHSKIIDKLHSIEELLTGELTTIRDLLLSNPDTLLTISTYKLNRYYGKKEFPVKKLIADALRFGIRETLGVLATVCSFSIHILAGKGFYTTYVNMCRGDRNLKQLWKVVNKINSSNDVDGTLKLLDELLHHHQFLIVSIPRSNIERFLKTVYI